MSGALFAFIAVLIAGIGARDQVLVSGLAARNGQHWALLAVGVVSAIAASAAAAWAARAIIPMLAPDARQILAALALALAGAEMLALRPKPLGAEPTQSLGATFIVLLAQQLTDASRFLVFAVAVATGVPFAAGAGGAVGGAAAMLGAWLLSDELARRDLKVPRMIGGAVLMVLAVVLVLGAINR